jgi:hypothetical protein
VNTPKINQLLVVLAFLIFSFKANADFTLFATHPYASKNWYGEGLGCAVSWTKADGRPIKALQAYDGGIYPSYGDWACNTGPVRLLKLDPSSGMFSLEYTLKTETIARFRVLAGKLYAIAIDPRGTANSGEVYAVKSGGAWSARTQAQIANNPADRIVHPHDMNIYNGALWVFSDFSDGLTQSSRATKSDDNGSTWSASISMPATGRAKALCIGEVFNNNLYVQEGDHDCNRIASDSSRIYDGSRWTVGPNLAPTGRAIKKANVFAGSMVLIHDDRLYEFDGSISAPASEALIHDYTIIGDELFVLRQSKQVCRTKDSFSYDCFDTAPSTAISIEVLGKFVYVGTTLGQIYRAPTLYVPDPNRANTAWIQALYYLLLDEKG